MASPMGSTPSGPASRRQAHRARTTMARDVCRSSPAHCPAIATVISGPRPPAPACYTPLPPVARHQRNTPLPRRLRNVLPSSTRLPCAPSSPGCAPRHDASRCSCLAPAHNLVVNGTETCGNKVTPTVLVAQDQRSACNGECDALDEANDADTRSTPALLHPPISRYLPAAVWPGSLLTADIGDASVTAQP